MLYHEGLRGRAHRIAQRIYQDLVERYGFRVVNSYVLLQTNDLLRRGTADNFTWNLRGVRGGTGESVNLEYN